MPSNVVTLNGAGGVSAQNQGVAASSAALISPKNFSQVVGLVPLTACDYEECRDSQQDACYFIPVFGHIKNGRVVTTPTYENDFNTFLIDYPLASQQSANNFIDIILERSANPWYNPNDFKTWEWETVAHLPQTLDGIYYPAGTFSDHPTYIGYALNWGQVYSSYGAGFYRVKFSLLKQTVKIIIIGGVPVTIPQTETIECAVSEPFHLLPWDCNRAHGTVKWEAWITGTIGSIDEDYKRFDLCDISWYDSIRMKSFFGDETTPKYEKSVVEYDSGLREKVRDKAVQSFKWRSNLLPKWVHDRFKAYGIMSDTLLVSDYNLNNADYFLKRKHVEGDSGYEPKYLGSKRFDKKMRFRQRASNVEVTFREGVESVDKSLCCLPKCP